MATLNLSATSSRLDSTSSVSITQWYVATQEKNGVKYVFQFLVWALDSSVRCLWGWFICYQKGYSVVMEYTFCQPNGPFNQFKCGWTFGIMMPETTMSLPWLHPSSGPMDEGPSEVDLYAHPPNWDGQFSLLIPSRKTLCSENCKMPPSPWEITPMVWEALLFFIFLFKVFYWMRKKPIRWHCDTSTRYAVKQLFQIDNIQFHMGVMRFPTSTTVAVQWNTKI